MDSIGSYFWLASSVATVTVKTTLGLPIEIERPPNNQVNNIILSEQIETLLNQTALNQQKKKRVSDLGPVVLDPMPPTDGRRLFLQGPTSYMVEVQSILFAHRYAIKNMNTIN